MSGYCTLADVKAYATNVQGSNLDDLINSLIDSESSEIDKFVERALRQATHTEVYNGEGTQFIPLDNWPVTAVSSVSIDGAPAMASTGVTAPGFAFSERGLWMRGARFPNGLQNISVTYTAGFTSANMPKDIGLACAELVAYRLNERGRSGQSSKILQGETVAYITKDLPDSVKGRLRDYKSYIKASR